MVPGGGTALGPVVTWILAPWPIAGMASTGASKTGVEPHRYQSSANPFRLAARATPTTPLPKNVKTSMSAPPTRTPAYMSRRAETCLEVSDASALRDSDRPPWGAKTSTSARVRSAGCVAQIPCASTTPARTSANASLVSKRAPTAAPALTSTSASPTRTTAERTRRALTRMVASPANAPLDTE